LGVPERICFLPRARYGRPDDFCGDWKRGEEYKVGDTYSLLNHEWHVAAIIEHGKGARLFVPISTLQELVGAPDKASFSC